MRTVFYSDDDDAYSADGDSTDDNATEVTDFGFGFNDPKFSDRILRVEILPDQPVAKLGKRIREEAEELHDAQLNGGSPSTSKSSCKVTIVHISSLVLAAKSPVFHKMFSNGMKESEQKTVTLSVHASEEKALLDLLEFLYNGKLSAKAPSDVLNVLRLADRYQVTSCARYCRRLMREFPMTLELALSYADLPATILADVSFRAPVRAATHFLSDIEDNLCLHEDALKLPSERIESILSSGELKVDSEDQVFDFALKWVTTNYGDLSERNEVFSCRICPLIRFPFMSDAKLKEALHCTELDQAHVAKMVAEALLEKAGNLHMPRVLNTTQCSERAYELCSVKVTVLDSPHQECIAYLALHEDGCFTVYNPDHIYTQPFHVGNVCFQLLITSIQGTKPSRNRMKIQLIWMSGGSDLDAVKLEYELAVRLESTGKYVRKEARSSVIEGKGSHCLLWYSAPSNFSQYSINGVFYFRVTVTLPQEEQAVCTT